MFTFNVAGIGGVITIAVEVFGEGDVTREKTSTAMEENFIFGYV